MDFQELAANMTAMNLISWAVLGLIVGIITHMIIPGKAGGGVLGTILLGLVGAFIGGFLAQNIFRSDLNVFSVQGLLMAVGGALILSFIYRVLFRESGRIKTNTKHFA